MTLLLGAVFALAIPLQELRGSEAQEHCHIHGRVVDERGAPVVGARVRVRGWRANKERIEHLGLPAQWMDPSTLTGADGAFDFRFVPPQAFQFTVHVAHDAYAALGWHWPALAAGEERAQGTVTLVRPGVIEGHIATPSGDLLVEQWSVQAMLQSDAEHYRLFSTKNSAIDPATGAFRFDDLPPGRVSLQAVRRSGERSPLVTVTTSSEEITYATLVYDAPDPNRTITLRLSSTRPAGLALEQIRPGAIRAVAADGTVHVFERVPNIRQEYTATNLPPGAYRVEVDDRRFERFEQHGVRLGETLRVQLVARGKLRVAVSAPDGTQISSYRLTLQRTAPSRSLRAEELKSAEMAPPPDGVYGGLPAGSYDVRITAEGVGAYRGVVRDLPVDGLQELEARLLPFKPLVGRVVHSSGTPVAGAIVQVTLGDLPGHDRGELSTVPVTVGEGPAARSVVLPHRDAAATCDEEGGFDLGTLAAGPAVVRVLLGDWIEHDIHVDLAEVPSPLVLTLPLLGSLHGRVVFTGARPNGELYLVPEHPHHFRLKRSRASGEARHMLGEDGGYQLGPLLAGPLVLDLIALERFPDEGSGASMTMGSLERVQVEVAPGSPTHYVLQHGIERALGQVHMQVTYAGVPATEPLEVMLWPRARFDAQGRERKAVRHTWQAGEPLVASIAPGTYDVTVSVAPAWSHAVTDPLEVTVGEVARVTVDVPVVHREVFVIEPDGSPCASSGVWVGLAGELHAAHVATTDERGKCVLSLPAGRYSLHSDVPHPLRADPAPAQDFEWAAGDWPLEVRLAAPR